MQSPVIRKGLSQTEVIIIIVIIVVVMAVGCVGATLVGLLLPAIGKARSQATLTQSQANLRNLAAAHAIYASEWNDRQFTLVDDDFGSFADLAEFNASRSEAHPPIVLGWERDKLYMLSFEDSSVPEEALWPIYPETGFGWFRIPNAQQFSQYVSGRFYDPVFYAPNDKMVLTCVLPMFDNPAEFVASAAANPAYWSSYCLSPAGLFNPEVMGASEDGGWRDPRSVSNGFRAPTMGQTLYPELKTHMIEHHWLQDRSGEDCNPAFGGIGTYNGCEPFYFNHAQASVPMALFYDGHIEGLGVAEALLADQRINDQTGGGLWLRDTPMGADGYFSDIAYDYSVTSYHVLTAGGARGRDKLGY